MAELSANPGLNHKSGGCPTLAVSEVEGSGRLLPEVGNLLRRFRERHQRMPESILTLSCHMYSLGR
jgi:hypothetical protein